MKKFISTVLAGIAAGALALATVTAMPQPVQAAAGTYTPHGGPFVTLSGGPVTFTVVEADFSFTCEQFDMPGSLFGPNDSRPFGMPVTTWDQLTVSGCSLADGGAVTVDLTGTWGFAITGPEVGSVSPAAITDAAMSVESGVCSFNVAGDITGTFDDATGLFTPTGSTQRIVAAPTGFLCPIVGLAQGQALHVSGSWTITGLTITNP
ncbi:hypothetical protein WBG06_23590 [Nocardioides sp. CCNWLW239]|uniref:hypothetical protein n=1 Tax=Nocardioides sp. CCNWLW239 TaxID=3128902 RepID=UPI00301A48DA